MEMEQSNRLIFHGISFVITITVENSATLIVEAEQEDSNDRWIGEFSSQYLEEISGKTGNFKRFDVFVKMLASALSQKSDSVFVDLLTYQDLERLKARKAGRPHSTTKTVDNTKGSTKRFLILTYVVEFDRVHYPLPLTFETTPNAQALLRTVARLKKELAQHHKNNSPTKLTSSIQQEAQNQELRKEFKRIVEENEQLKLEIMKAKEHPNNTGARAGGGHRAWENDGEKESLRKKVSTLTAQLTEERSQHRKLQVRYRREVGRLGAELEREKTAARALRTKCQDLQRQLRARADTQPSPYGPRSSARGRSSSRRRGMDGGGSSRSGSATASTRKGTRRRSRGQSSSTTPNKQDTTRPAWGAGSGASRKTTSNTRGNRSKRSTRSTSSKRFRRNMGYNSGSGYSSANSQASKASSTRSAYSNSSQGSARSRASSVHSKISRTSSNSSRRSRTSTGAKTSKSSRLRNPHPRTRTPSPSTRPKYASSPDTNSSSKRKPKYKPKGSQKNSGSYGSVYSRPSNTITNQQRKVHKPSPSPSKNKRGSARARRNRKAANSSGESELISENIMLAGPLQHPFEDLPESRNLVALKSSKGRISAKNQRQQSVGLGAYQIERKNSGVLSSDGTGNVISKQTDDLSTALEISDIDQRLNALQDFLRQAKSGIIS